MSDKKPLKEGYQPIKKGYQPTPTPKPDAGYKPPKQSDTPPAKPPKKP